MKTIFQKSHTEALAALHSTCGHVKELDPIIACYKYLSKQSHLDEAVNRCIYNHGDSVDEFFDFHSNMYKISLYPKDFEFLSNKVITALRVASLIEEIVGDNTQFSNGLDICCGSGIHAMTYKKLGLAKSFTGIDIVDRSTDLDIDINEMIINAIGSLFVSAELGNVDSEWISGTSHPHYFGQDPYCTFLDKDKMMNATSDINYVVGDFLGDTVFEKPFDLVTLYAGIEHFKLKQFYSALSRMTVPGALFVTVNDYYWEAQGSSMHLPTLPWMHAFLPMNLYFDYVSSLYGDLGAKIVEKMYYFGEFYATASDHVTCAAENGFDLLYQRKVPTFVQARLSQPQNLAITGLNRFDLSKVNSSLQLSDLNTYYLLQVYRKR